MKVTVAIPIYNAENHLQDAIQSVLNQTYTNFELLLLDDGSVDRSMSIASGFNDSRIRIISDGINKGLPSRLNEVVELASGDLIARMDADDIIPNDRLKIQVDYLAANPDKDLVSMGMAYFDNDEYFGHFVPHNVDRKLTIDDMKFGRSGICHATLLVRKNWYQRNIYRRSMKRIEDFELWLRTYKDNDLNIGFIDKVGYFYRSDNTLNYKKYLGVYKSFLSIFSGLSKGYGFDFFPLLFNLGKFSFISMVFFLGKQERYLSMRNRSEKSLEVQLYFDEQMKVLRKELC